MEATYPIKELENYENVEVTCLVRAGIKFQSGEWRKEISNLHISRKDEENSWRRGYEDGDDALEGL